MHASIIILLFRGKDFRKSFASVGDLLAVTKVPIMCLTASAPPDIESGILQALHLRDPVFIRGSLNRPNIFYCVRKKSSLEVSINSLKGNYTYCIIFRVISLELQTV